MGSSNLCTEIIEYSSADETAVCNLASLNLQKFISCAQAPGSRPYFDFERLVEVTRVVTRNLNAVIDVNYYPVQSLFTKPRSLMVCASFALTSHIFFRFLQPRRAI